MKNIVIIGGGAAGLVCAVSAAQSGKQNVKVTLLEKNERVGKKILVTGNGRCNLTNINISVKNYHGQNPSFVRHALDCFGPERTIDFFKSIGLMTVVEEEGRVYPLCGQASAVLDVLRLTAVYLGVEIKSSYDVREIGRVKNKFKVTPVSEEDEAVYTDSLVVATGGYGHDGHGYTLLKSMGHTITKPYPALVQLKTDKQWIKGLKGIRFNGGVRLKYGVQEAVCERGELIFTDYGVSGIPILNISGHVSQRINISGKNDAEAALDFFPTIEKGELAHIIDQRRQSHSHLTMEDFFTGTVNKRIAYAVARRAGIENLSIPVDRVTPAAFNRIVALFKEYSLPITGTNSINDAQVTGGGTDTGQFDDETMQSRLVHGLYAAGEVLDIYGDCGGYNLQWAWASGHIAGEHAVKELK